MNLVVGSTGQLGTAIVRRLIEQGKPVRALVRRTAEYRHLEDAGAELAFGDLRDPATLDTACRGVAVVISTATGISPGKGGGDVKAVDGEGYGNLIEACKRAGVRQFIFSSVPPSPFDDRMPLFRSKRATERRLEASGIAYTIFQLGMFADIWPALLGSSIPQRGAEVRTLDRPFWFLRIFRKATGEMIEKKGKASVPGTPGTRVSFIAIDDVASMMVGAIGRAEAMRKTFQVGGPEVLTWAETIDVFSRVLGKPIKPAYTPAPVFRALQLALAPISLSASSIMGLNWVTASGALPVPDPEESKSVAALFGAKLTPFEQFLREKAALAVRE